MKENHVLRSFFFFYQPFYLGGLPWSIVPVPGHKWFIISMQMILNGPVLFRLNNSATNSTVWLLFVASTWGLFIPCTITHLQQTQLFAFSLRLMQSIDNRQVSETLTEWKSESMTDGPTNERTRPQGNALLQCPPLAPVIKNHLRE